MMSHSITWAPWFPWWVIGALGVVAILLLAFALYRRATGIPLRILAFGILLLALANPSMVAEERQALSDIVFVISDETPSQDIGRRRDQGEAALSQLLARLDRLENTEYRVIRVTGRDTEAAEDGGTRLFSALRRGLAGVPRQRVGAVFMISDGQVHDVPEALSSLGLEAPLHLLLTGEDVENDRRLVMTQAPTFGLVGKPLSLGVTVEELGSIQQGAPARLELRQDGELVQSVIVPVGEEQSLDFELEHRGTSVLELSVEPGEQELTLANNQVVLQIKGVRERLRVLLVSGEPHAGERAWRNILKSDPSVDLVHFTILRPPEKQDGTPIRELSLIAFPTRELFEVKLDEFDLIIFDRYRRRGVLPSIYLANIADYVVKGGALLEAVGPTFATPLSLYRTPLGKVLPGEPSGTIFEQGYRPKVTDLGRRHPVTSDLQGAGSAEETPTWGRWFRHIDARSREGAVVMSGVEERPLLLLARVGEGRVAQMMSDHMWLWSRGYEGGGPQAQLLRRIAHWLMREPELEEESLSAEIKAGRLEITRRSLSEEHPEVEVSFPSGRTELVEMTEQEDGKARATLAAEEFGLYRVSDGTRLTLAAAGSLNPLEFNDLRSTDTLLRALVEASLGGVRRVADTAVPRLQKIKPGRDAAGRGWLGVNGQNAFVVAGVDEIPLLPGFLLLLLALSSLLLTWLREGR